MDCSSHLSSSKFPLEIFNFINSFSPLSSQNSLAQTCKELNMRITLIKEEYFTKMIRLDLKYGNEDDHQSFKLYFKELNFLNKLSQDDMPNNRSKTFAKISILSGFEWNIILELYENLDIIEELDFSQCVVEELMPKDDLDPRWIHGLFDGKNIKNISLPAEFLPYSPLMNPAGPAALLPPAGPAALPPLVHLVATGKKNLFRKIIDRLSR